MAYEQDDNVITITVDMDQATWLAESLGWSMGAVEKHLRRVGRDDKAKRRQWQGLDDILSQLNYEKHVWYGDGVV